MPSKLKITNLDHIQTYDPQTPKSKEIAAIEGGMFAQTLEPTVSYLDPSDPGVIVPDTIDYPTHPCQEPLPPDVSWEDIVIKPIYVTEEPFPISNGLYWIETKDGSFQTLGGWCPTVL